MLQNLLRAFQTTLKQMKRSGWLAWASIIVMTLSFLVTTVFLILAFVLNLVLKSIENEPHIYVFYEPGTPEKVIMDTYEDWNNLSNIDSIIYTSEEDALKEFKQYNQKTNPVASEAIREGVLPASLGIRLKSIEEADKTIALVENEKETSEYVTTVGYSETVIENIKDIVNIVRIIGIVIVSLLIIVILLFTLLTTEFKIYHRSEEIGVMQLVGGSLWYIRLPFIIENAIYGLIGALLSNIILVGSYYGILQYYSQSDLLKFIHRFFGSLPWPVITIEHLILIFLGILGVGALIGSINSYFAIRGYIK
ncbi:FtsX-like permease family protein [Candidatus Dojkabacteria bacterium]|nr:FtsX-like permease family protein [Candidatus Dojkabacteria bacterium]